MQAVDVESNPGLCPASGLPRLRTSPIAALVNRVVPLTFTFLIPLHEIVQPAWQWKVAGSDWRC